MDGEIDLAALKAAGVIRHDALRAKVIASGTIERAVVLRGISDPRCAGGDRTSRRKGRGLKPMAASPLAFPGKMTELRQRILFVLGAMVVFRLGTHIPIPGVDPTAVAALFEQTRVPSSTYSICFPVERLSVFRYLPLV